MILKKEFFKLIGKSKNYVILQDIKNKRYSATYGPRYVTIDITNKCNFNCICCWTYSHLLNKENKPKKAWFNQELPYHLIVDLIKDLKDTGTEEIRLTGGGEPFLHPKILDIISLIKKNNFKLDITTNFSLVNKKKIDKLIGLGVDNITISIWASNPDTYIKLHPNQKKTTFTKIKNNIEYLNKKKTKTKVVLANVISNINHNEISKMVEFAKKTNSDEVYFTLIDPIKDNTDSLLLNKEQQDELIKTFQQIVKKYKKKKYDNLIIDNPETFLRRIENKDLEKGNYDSNIVLKIPCTVGWTFSRILANGNVSPCCRGVMVPTGNLYKKRFKKIWNDYKQRKFRKIGSRLKDYPKFIKKVGCVKTCDNIMDNINNFEELKKKPSFKILKD